MENIMVKKNPKIIILGIDGLEYNFVKEWKLSNIQQKKYCEVDLSDYKVIVTPPIWGSMLTGSINQEVMDQWIKRSSITGDESAVNQVWWARLGNKILPKKVSFWIWKRFFVPKMGGNLFEETSDYIKQYSERIFLDSFDQPWNNGIPGYNRREQFLEEKEYQNKVFDEGWEEFHKYLVNDYNESVKQLYDCIERKENDIIFWYTKLVDSICHFCKIKPIDLMKYYLQLNQLVGSVQQKCPDSTIYVISDHGMKYEKNAVWWHSDHAFFSSNNGEIISKPTDLYNIVLKK